MTEILLAATHGAAFLVGVFVTYLAMVRYVRVREVDGHTTLAVCPPEDDDCEDTTMPFRPENRHLTLSLMLLVFSLFVVAIGVQSYVAVQDDRDRDREDREYADCLSDFAEDLVGTIQTRTAASARIEEAAERKSNALDRLLRITALLNRNPPEATRKEFAAALEARVRAQARYDQVEAEVEATRQENPYVNPKVVCER